MDGKREEEAKDGAADGAKGGNRIITSLGRNILNFYFKNTPVLLLPFIYYFAKEAEADFGKINPAKVIFSMVKKDTQQDLWLDMEIYSWAGSKPFQNSSTSRIE